MHPTVPVNYFNQLSVTNCLVGTFFFEVFRRFGLSWGVFAFSTLFDLEACGKGFFFRIELKLAFFNPIFLMNASECFGIETELLRAFSVSKMENMFTVELFLVLLSFTDLNRDESLFVSLWEVERCLKCFFERSRFPLLAFLFSNWHLHIFFIINW